MPSTFVRSVAVGAGGALGGIITVTGVIYLAARLGEAHLKRIFRDIENELSEQIAKFAEQSTGDQPNG